MAAPDVKRQQSSAVTEHAHDLFDDGASRQSTLRGDEESNVKMSASDQAETSQHDGSNSDLASTQLVCYGRYGKISLWIGIALMYIVFETDHTVLYSYQNYAASEFNSISSLGALTTAGTILIAIFKPPIAKVSSVIGKVETYVAIIALYVMSYIICGTAPNFGQYTCGFVIYSIAATGLQILNAILVADITTSRWRGLANSLVSVPFMVVPWVSAFLVDSTLSTIGWRWGIGIFALILPVASLSVIGPLLYFRHHDKSKRETAPPSTTAKSFFAAIDIIGIVLLALGCSMFLLPMSLAGTMTGGWTAPWVPTVMATGIAILAMFAYYETRCATNPIMPAKYFKSLSLIIACSIGLLDAFAYQVTHTYMYAWCTVVHDFSARDATFLTYTSGCFQAFAGLITGLLMFRTRKYKWLLVIGTIIRIAGYGIMMRLRGATNPISELFIVQAIQGVGSGTVGTVVIVIAQVVVPSADLGQATALILLSIFMGQAIGSAVAGGIYTNLFKPCLRAYLGVTAPQSLIDSVFNSITTSLPRMGSPERTAIHYAYSDVLRYMTVSALIASAIPFIMVWFLPNLQLTDSHNVSDQETQEKSAWTNDKDKPAHHRDYGTVHVRPSRQSPLPDVRSTSEARCPLKRDQDEAVRQPLLYHLSRE